jgi:lauroyl/myristoyl acyltransferase
MLVALDRRMPQDRMVLLARRHALFLSSILFDTQFILTCPSTKVDNTVRMEGVSHVDAALEKGQGVMFLGCHAGYFYRAIFAAARETARKGKKLHVINILPEYARRGLWKGKAEYLLYQKLVKRMEQEPNLQIEYIGGSLEGVYQGLRMGEIVAANVDVPLPQGDRRAVQIKFLGRDCYFSSQLVRLARRLNAVCLPFVTHMEGDLCWTRLHPPWTRTDNKAFGDPDTDAETRHIFRILEKHILTYPEQWWLWNDLGGFASDSCDKDDLRVLKDV